MDQVYREIPNDLITWISEQDSFWITVESRQGRDHGVMAPSAIQVQVPLHIPRPDKVWYEDAGGSSLPSQASANQQESISAPEHVIIDFPPYLQLSGSATLYEIGGPDGDLHIDASVHHAIMAASTQEHVVIIDVDNVVPAPELERLIKIGRSDGLAYLSLEEVDSLQEAQVLTGRERALWSATIRILGVLALFMIGKAVLLS